MSVSALLGKIFRRNSASRGKATPFADPGTLAKGVRREDRFREVVADPVNLLIRRVPEAGFVDAAGQIVLHNGLRVPLRGPGSYYGDFSDLLIINRGVHEPLEEYCFQEVLALLPERPVMLELGAYWAHYSMWLKQARPAAVCHMVESDPVNLAAGRANFERNHLAGEFHLGFVAQGAFEVDRFLEERGLPGLDILHADIQGHEAEMLDGAAKTLAARRAGRVFVSTHSEALHASVEARLRAQGYLIEASSSFESHTTSYDGFILASAPGLQPVLGGWQALGRLEMLRADPARLLRSIAGRVGSPA